MGPLAEAAAGVGHHVAASVVGIDEAPGGYYAVKREQEALVRADAVPWSIVRATQFHALVHGLLRWAARGRVIPGPALLMQPVDEREVAAVLADAAEASPTRAIARFAGPRGPARAQRSFRSRRPAPPAAACAPAC